MIEFLLICIEFWFGYIFIVYKSFENRGVRIVGFVDNRNGPVDRHVKKWPAWGFYDLPPPKFLDKFRDTLIVLAIGDSKGQTAFSELLQKLGFIENHDFVRVIYNWPPVLKLKSQTN